MIQRALEGRRAIEIANYLTNNKDRFFSSLVLAVYGGRPDWLEIGVHGNSHTSEMPVEAKDSVGFLRFTGSEKIFAIDGQHRLSGIKYAIDNNLPLADELVPVIFVGHSNTKPGMQRTRRIFTTLNKTAVAVTKRDIIALDEDDVMAITARRLFETEKRFEAPRTAIVATNNLPQTSSALTTIGNLYDILKIIFMHHSGVSRDTTLRFNRPSDDKLEAYYDIASRYFNALAKNYPELDEYYRSKDPASTSRKFRSSQGGHILFRPIGLEIVTRAVVSVSKQRSLSLEKSVQIVSKIENQLNNKPFEGVIWDPGHGTIITRGKALAKRLVFYMLNLPCGEDTLLDDYRSFLGKTSLGSKASLPQRVV